MRPNVDKQLEDFIYHEMSLLDERRYAEWVELFADDGIYWIPADPNHEHVEGEVPDTASLVYDNKSRLLERVIRLESPAMWSERPRSNVVRMITNLRCLDDPRVVEGRILVVQSRGEDLNQYAGRVRYRFVEAEGIQRMKEKQVLLINALAHMRNLGFIP